MHDHGFERPITHNIIMSWDKSSSATQDEVVLVSFEGDVYESYCQSNSIP